MTKRLERWFFYFFIFLAPFQLRKILWIWPQPVTGWFNEWTSAFVYASDFLIFILLCFLVWRWFKNRSFAYPSRSSFFLLVFLAVAALSLIKANNRLLGFYQLIKLTEMIGLFYYFRQAIGSLVSFGLLLWAIMVSALGQAATGIIQALTQKSLGLWWLGESVLRPNFSGVAVVPGLTSDVGKWLRVYGFTPHPNILAAWLFMGIFSFYFWYLYAKEKRSWWSAAVIYVPLLLAFFFTFSRVAVSLWLLGIVGRLLVVLIRKDHYHFPAIFKQRLKQLILITVTTSVLFTLIFWPQVFSRLHFSSSEQAVTDRLFYNHLGQKTVIAHPWLGVGLGQWVWQLRLAPSAPAYLYQPIHNLYLLVASEIGLAGLAVWLVFIFYLVKNYILRTHFQKLGQLSFFVVVASILAMGLFDHFLWTSQQGQILLWSVLGTVAGISESQGKVI